MPLTISCMICWCNTAHPGITVTGCSSISVSSLLTCATSTVSVSETTLSAREMEGAGVGDDHSELYSAAVKYEEGDVDHSGSEDLDPEASGVALWQEGIGSGEGEQCLAGMTRFSSSKGKIMAGVIC